MSKEMMDPFAVAKVVVCPFYKGGHKVTYYYFTKEEGEKGFCEKNGIAYRSKVSLYYRYKSGRWYKVAEELDCNVYDFLKY